MEKVKFFRGLGDDSYGLEKMEEEVNKWIGEQKEVIKIIDMKMEVARRGEYGARVYLMLIYEEIEENEKMKIK